MAATLTDTRHRRRDVARVLVIDRSDRLLLFDTRLSYTRVWMAPGGGLLPGETFVQGAVRELWEETGHRVADVGRCVWTMRFRFERGGILYDQTERYFTTRVESLDVSGANWEPGERSQIQTHRWWSLQEIADSRASFRPDELSALLPQILGGNLPEEPALAHVEHTARVV